jgi:hypothetical protein
MALSLPAYGHLGYIWDAEILDNMHLRGMGYEGFDCTSICTSCTV